MLLSRSSRRKVPFGGHQLAEYTLAAAFVAVGHPVLAEYVDHYNGHQPHRSLDQRCPSAVTEMMVPITDPDSPLIRRTDVLGGLIHEYRLVA
jgi:hypothetical protein